MHLITGRQYLTDVFHFLVHLRTEFKLVGSFLGCNGKVNGVQPIDAVVALGLFFHMCHAHQFVQPHQFTILCFHRNIGGIEMPVFLFFRHQCQAYPLLASLAGFHIMDAQELPMIMPVNSRRDIVYANAQTAQLLAVIFQPPFHRGCPAQFYFVNAVQAGKAGFNVLFRILLDKYR